MSTILISRIEGYFLTFELFSILKDNDLHFMFFHTEEA